MVEGEGAGALIGVKEAATVLLAKAVRGCLMPLLLLWWLLFLLLLRLLLSLSFS